MTEKKPIDSREPVHNWFGLTYSSYFTIPRAALQAMPVEWQMRFVELMEEAEAAGLETPEYHVLRDDPAYTHVKRYDEDDETSRPFEFTAVREDPWAQHRRPDESLLPERLKKRWKPETEGKPS